MKTEGYILIGENTETEEFREYRKMSYGDIPAPFIQSFSKIMLRPGEQIGIQSEFKTLIIPLTGGLEAGKDNVLIPGECRLINDTQTALINASPDFETVFLNIELSNPPIRFSEIHQIKVNVDNPDNPLEPYLGLYHYRDDKTYRFKNSSDCFIYVISGNFEMEERFVNQGDSLILENINTLNFECLTEQGLFLMLKA